MKTIVFTLETGPVATKKSSRWDTICISLSFSFRMRKSGGSFWIPSSGELPYISTSCTCTLCTVSLDRCLNFLSEQLRLASRGIASSSWTACPPWNQSSFAQRMWQFTVKYRKLELESKRYSSWAGSITFERWSLLDCIQPTWEFATQQINQFMREAARSLSIHQTI